MEIWCFWPCTSGLRYWAATVYWWLEIFSSGLHTGEESPACIDWYSEVTLEQLEVHDGSPPKPTSDIRDYLNMVLQWYHYVSCVLSDDHNKIASFFYYLCLPNGSNYLTSNPLCGFITGGLNDLKSPFLSKWAQALSEDAIEILGLCVQSWSS